MFTCVKEKHLVFNFCDTFRCISQSLTVQSKIVSGLSDDSVTPALPQEEG